MFPFHNSAYFFGSWQSQNSSGMSSKVNRIKGIKEDFTSLQLLIYLIENKVVFPMGAASMNTDPPPPRPAPPRFVHPHYYTDTSFQRMTHHFKHPCSCGVCHSPSFVDREFFFHFLLLWSFSYHYLLKDVQQFYGVSTTVALFFCRWRQSSPWEYVCGC